MTIVCKFIVALLLLFLGRIAKFLILHTLLKNSACGYVYNIALKNNIPRKKQLKK